jgi:hypothetical protein
MLNHLSELKKASLFYFIVMALSLTLVMFFRLAAPKSEIVMLANMLTPALAAVIMLYVLTSDGYKRKAQFSLGLTRSGWHSWGLALLLPLAVLTITYGLAWLSVRRVSLPPQALAGSQPLIKPLINAYSYSTGLGRGNWLSRVFTAALAGTGVNKSRGYFRIFTRHLAFASHPLDLLLSD